jgi:predicted MFS family arabinose efflux permease
VTAEVQTRHQRRVAQIAVISGYLAVTVAESILAPLFPSVTDELGIGLDTAGMALAFLSGSIAVGNLIGGWILSRFGPRAGLVVSLVLTAAGSAWAALATDGQSFVIAQTLIGGGAGVFFAPGIQLVGRTAAPGRRGFAMGLFGVAFSGGLAIAALLAALGATTGWRIAFWVAAVICLLGAGASLVIPLPPRAPQSAKRRWRLDASLAKPVTVGAVGTLSQYGTVGFMALFAVSAWDLTPAAAALVVAAGRVLSVPGKLVVGSGSDKWGTRATLTVLTGCLVVTGVLWTFIPAAMIAIPAAILFSAAVSGLFPIANVLALEEFEDQGTMLGVFRSAHIALGAVGAWLIGVIAAEVGLDLALRVSAMAPLLLLLLTSRRSLASVR